MPTSGNTEEEALRADRLHLYFVTDLSRLGERSLLTLIRHWISRGLDFVQIREKNLSDDHLFDLTRKVVALARNSRCRILVNGRADIALAAGAHGVHLPSQGLRPPDLAAWIPRRFIIGVSTHSLRESQRAESDGAAYVLLGPVFRTPSKLKYGPPLGCVYLDTVARRVRIPVFAIGGIHPGNIPDLLQTQVSGIAGISLFQEDLDPRKREAEIFITTLKKT